MQSVFLVSAFALFLSIKLTAGSLSYPSLTTESGVLYEAVRVLKIDPDSITIMHKNGGCRIKVEDLPTDLRKQLNIELTEEAKAFRAEREAKQRAAQKAQRDAELEEARKRQRAFIAKLVEQQELELSRVAQVRVKRRHDKGYLCTVAYPVTSNVTKQVTTPLGGTKTVVTGQKTHYIPEDGLIYLTSTKKLSKNRKYLMRIIHEEPYSYTSSEGSDAHTQKYRVIKGISPPFQIE